MIVTNFVSQFPQSAMHFRAINTKLSLQVSKSILYCTNLLPTVRPGRLIDPLEGSKKTSREEEARSSNTDANAGGSSGLPFAI